MRGKKFPLIFLVFWQVFWVRFPIKELIFFNLKVMNNFYNPDGIYVSLPNYQVDTEVAGNQPFGHGFVIAVNEDTGSTRGSEYGRYGGRKGSAHRVVVPDFKMKKPGDPTPEELQQYSKVLLHSYKRLHPNAGNKIKITYVRGADENKMIQMMKSAESGNRKKGFYINKDYRILDHNCGTYGADMIDKSLPWLDRGKFGIYTFGRPGNLHPLFDRYTQSYTDDSKGNSINWKGLWKGFKSLF